MEEKSRDAKRPTIERAIDVLFALGHLRSGASVTEIAAEFGLSKGHVHRFISILESYGLAFQDQVSRRYKLGHGIVKLADMARQQSDLRAAARPYLERLAETTRETVGIWALFGDRYVCWDSIESTQAVRRHVRLGEPAPLHVGGPGRAILAYLSAEQRERTVTGPLQAFTANTITDPTELRAELDRIRNRGYAIGMKESEAQAFSVVAPILDSSDRVIASIGVAAPITRYDADLVEQYGVLVMEAADAISRSLMGLGPVGR